MKFSSKINNNNTNLYTGIYTSTCSAVINVCHEKSVKATSGDNNWTQPRQDMVKIRYKDIILNSEIK